jgi:hypothetical protein
MAYTNLTFEDRLNNAFLKSLWLKRDIAAFADFNPSKFTAQFVADYEAAYQTALLLPSDENMTDIGTEKTALVNLKMEAARNLYQKKIKYFLEEAFSAKAGLLNSFGFDDYQTVRTSVAGMISFLTNLKVRCAQEQTALLAVGISNTFLTEIETAKDELVDAYTDQQTYFGSQKDMTQTRKAAFEAMDNFVKEVCKVGKIIFEGVNDAKYSDYIIYKTRTNSETITKTLPPNTELPVLDKEADANISLQVENIGNTELVIYVNDELKTNATGYTLPINTNTILTTNTLSVGSYGMLIARNGNPIEGKVRIKLMEAVADEEA